MGRFYFTGKNVLNERLSEIADKNVYKRGENVLPFHDDNPMLFVDFVSELSIGQTVDIYLNGNLETTVSVVDSNGMIYANIKLNYGENDIRVHIGSTEITDPNKRLRQYRFTTKNYIFLVEIYVIMFENIKRELEAIKNDTFWNTIRDSRLEEIFGTKLRFPHFNNLSLELYRKALVGENDTDKPGLRGALFSQSVEAGITKIVKSILGSIPEFNSYFDFTGWKLFAGRKYQLQTPAGFFNSITNPIVDTDPDVDHYFIENNDLIPKKAILDFHQHKVGTLQVVITDADIEVTEEAVIKSPSGAEFDLLANTFINYNKPITITQGVNTYVYGVDFSIDFLHGKVLWFLDDGFSGNLLSGFMPAANTAYFIAYWYFPDALLQFLFKRVKPAHIKLEILYYDTNGDPFYPFAAIWDLDNWDDSFFG